MQAESDVAVAEADCPDLATVPTGELMAEFVRRFHFSAMIGATYGPDGGLQLYDVRWAGNRHTVMGLCDDLKARVQDDTTAFVQRSIETAQSAPAIDAE